MNTQRPIPVRADRDAYERERARSLVRGITALALGVGPRQRDAAAALVQRAWPHDGTAERITKGAVLPTVTTGGFPLVTTASVLQSLAPASASAQLFARSLQVDLSGVSKVRVPHVSASPQPGFIPEGAVAPVAQFSLAGVDVGPVKKILILTGITGELEAATPDTASAVIGRALAEAVAKSVDAAVFSDIAADATRPAGLLYGVTPISSGTAPPSDAEMMARDLTDLAVAMSSAGVDPSGMVLIANWAQAIKLRLLSGPNFDNLVLGTNALSDGTVVAIAPAGIAFGYAGIPEIDVSKEAAVHFEDTTPLAISTPGTPNVVSAPVRSAFQTDCLVIRVRARCAWAALPHAVQVINSVTW